MPELLREHFCCFEVFFLLLSPSVFHLLAVFQSVPLAFMLSYFSSSFLCFILPFQKNDQVKASSNLTSATKAKVSAKPQHQKEEFSREMLVFLFIWQVCLLCVQASNPTNFLKSHSFLCSSKSLTFYLTFLAVMLASTQAREWHNLRWGLRTVHMLWSLRCVWWHDRSMLGECPYRKQWIWPTCMQYTCAIELVTSETWNNQGEKSQRVTEEIFMLRLGIPS